LAEKFVEDVTAEGREVEGGDVEGGEVGEPFE
jgi:hypothetical protein